MILKKAFQIAKRMQGAATAPTEKRVLILELNHVWVRPRIHLENGTHDSRHTLLQENDRTLKRKREK